MFSPALIARAEGLVGAYRSRGWRVVTAESCTGGLIAALLTEIPGSSSVVERGFVTYSNQAKTDLIGVPAGLIAAHGAVSRPVADAMSQGALARSRATVAVSVTGIAGPGGGTPMKPVGLVFLARAQAGTTPVVLERRYGEQSRHAIRLAALGDALRLLEEALHAPPQAGWGERCP